MNTRNTLVLLLLIAILLLVGVLIMRKTDLQQSALDQKTSPEQSVPAPEAPQKDMRAGRESGIGPITALLSAGKSLRCIYSSTNTSLNKEKGVVYLDGAKQIRTDSQLVTGGTDKEVHVINNGAALYTWTVSEKGKTATMKPLIPVPTASEPAHVLYDIVRYNCNPWETDTALFVPPTDIQFTGSTSTTTH